MMDVRSGLVELSSLNVRKVKNPSHTTTPLGWYTETMKDLGVVGGGEGCWNLELGT